MISRTLPDSTKTLNAWNDGVTMHKQVSIYVMLAILACVIVGYLPALIADFVPQDQWRAFDYGLDIDGAGKWAACVERRVEYYIRTGRPLVWIPECIEHAFVHDIGDYKFLRLPALMVALVTMLIGGLVFRGIVSRYWQGVFLSVPIVLSPGYAFMVYQGDTAGGVLAATAFALASAYFALIFLRQGFSLKGKNEIAAGIWATAFFFLALFNYPAFAFIAFSAVFFAQIYSGDIALERRLGNLAAIFIFYGILCVIYFGITKAVLHFLPYQDVGKHQFSLIDPIGMLGKMRDLMTALFADGRIINFYGIPYVGIAVVAGAALFVPTGSQISGLPERMAPKVVFMLLFPLIAVFGSMPLILSNFQALLTRVTVPGNFMVGFAACFLLIKLGEICADRFRAPAAPLLVCLLAMVTVAVQQQRISYGLVEDSAIEVRAVRNAVDAMVREAKWNDGTHIHVIRPNRLAFSQNFTWFDSREYAPATTQHPEHIKQMFTMALRERLDENDLARMRIRDCQFDVQCGMSGPGSYEIVLTQARDSAINPPWTGAYNTLDLSILDWKDAWK